MDAAKALALVLLAGCRLDVPAELDRDAPGDGDAGADAPGTDGAPAPRCGDGTIRPGVEECDDGNLVDGDLCSALCSRCLIGDSRVVGADHHCYARFGATKSWTEALDDCAQRGLELATFQEGGTSEVITAIRMPGGGYNLFFGLGSEGDGIFRWVTGEDVTLASWADGEPNGGGACARTTDAATWEDADCAAAHQYVCEDPGWTIGPGNHAYKLLAAPWDWDQAVAVCTSLGAHLATVTGQAEQDFLDGWLALSAVWLGGRSEGSDFAWVTGEPVAFTAWASGEPAAVAPPACIVWTDAGWIASSCAGPVRPAVCEID